MAGVWLDQGFQSTKRIPVGVDRDFEKQIGRKTIGTKPASGTEIIKELAKKCADGKPIVYTSGDSVFQSPRMRGDSSARALHMCEVARKLLDGPTAWDA